MSNSVLKVTVLVDTFNQEKASNLREFLLPALACRTESVNVNTVTCIQSAEHSQRCSDTTKDNFIAAFGEETVGRDQRRSPDYILFVAAPLCGSVSHRKCELHEQI